MQRLEGEAMAPFLVQLARLRIEVFRAWPYLYDGDLDYESNYLQTYMRTPNSVLVVALDGEQVVGAATGVPLAHETDNIVAAVSAQRSRSKHTVLLWRVGTTAGLPWPRGWSRVLRASRGACTCVGRFHTRLFLWRDRPAEHVSRPPDYVPLDDFWRNRGYQPMPDVVASFSWKDVGCDEESHKSMGFG